MNRPLLLGHRGARKYAPENTIEAFRLALEYGCDGFEFDVRLTADGRAVVCHDLKVSRCAVARSSYQKLSERCAGICVLEDVLSSCGSSAFLNVELKVAGAEELTLELLRRGTPVRGVVVSSFLPKVVRRLQELGSEFDVGIICGNHAELTRWKKLPVGAVMLHRGLASRRVVAEIQGAGKRVFVWTVNSAREMAKFAEMGVDGIISDDTKLLVETVGRPELRG